MELVKFTIKSKFKCQLIINLACYLIKYEKMSAEDAIQHVREKRRGSIQSFVQEELIFQYAKTILD